MTDPKRVEINIRDGLSDLGRRKMALGFVPEATSDEIDTYIKHTQAHLEKVRDLFIEVFESEDFNA